MSGVRSHTLKALRELAMIFLVMIERDKKVNTISPQVTYSDRDKETSPSTDKGLQSV